MIRYNAPGVQQTEREISGGTVSIWDGPHVVEDNGRRYAVSRSVEINRGRRGVSVAYVIRAAAVSLALAAMLSGCGEYKAPPYSFATIAQNGHTYAGNVELWEDVGDGTTHIVLSENGERGVHYYATPDEITFTKGWG